MKAKTKARYGKQHSKIFGGKKFILDWRYIKKSDAKERAEEIRAYTGLKWYARVTKCHTAAGKTRWCVWYRTEKR